MVFFSTITFQLRYKISGSKWNERNTDANPVKDLKLSWPWQYLRFFIKENQFRVTFINENK